MGRFRAVTQVAAFFLSTVAGSPLALACENCELLPSAEQAPKAPSSWSSVGHIDVTTAMDSATSLLADVFRGLRRWSSFGLPQGEVHITEQALGGDAAQADIYDETSDEMPIDSHALGIADDTIADDPARTPPVGGFQYDHQWQLTYRSDAAEAISQPAQSDRFPAMNTTLDDSTVVGLRFQMKYGWKR